MSSATTFEDQAASGPSRHLKLYSVIGGCLWLLLAATMWALLPRFRDLFADFGVEMNAVTSFVLESGDLAGLLVVLSAMAIAVLRRDMRSQLFALIWLPIIVFGVLVLAIGLPFLGLLSDLS